MNIITAVFNVWLWRLASGEQFLRQSLRAALFSGPYDLVFPVVRCRGQGQGVKS